LSLGVLLNNIAELLDRDARFHMSNCFIQTFTCCFDETNIVGISF
jgi:hypothetical protein